MTEQYFQEDRLRRVEQEQADMREVLGALKESQQAISSRCVLYSVDR